MKTAVDGRTSALDARCAAEAGAKLQRCVLAVSAPHAAGAATPYPDAPVADLDALAARPNVSVVETRVTKELLEAELAPLRALGTVRVVVSGPEAFNGAVKEMLVKGLGVDEKTVTILEA